VSMAEDDSTVELAAESAGGGIHGRERALMGAPAHGDDRVLGLTTTYAMSGEARSVPGGNGAGA